MDENFWLEVNTNLGALIKIIIISMVVFYVGCIVLDAMNTEMITYERICLEVCKHNNITDIYNCTIVSAVN